MKRFWILVVLAAVLVVCKDVSYASGGGGNHGGGSFYSDTSDHSAFEKAQRVQGLYQKGVEATNSGDFEKAIGFFQDVLKINPDDADAWNMLAHAQRMTGKIDESLVNYKKALELQPDFPQAREYLGEAYLQAALREAGFLEKGGDTGREQLEILKSAFKDAAAKLNDAPAAEPAKTQP